jgi:hypothetical protein
MSFSGISRILYLPAGATWLLYFGWPEAFRPDLELKTICYSVPKEVSRPEAAHPCMPVWPQCGERGALN